MKRIFFALFMGLVLCLISGCSNEDLESLNAKTNEIVELKKLISEKDKEITLLKEGNSNKSTKLSELIKSLNMVRWSSSARIGDYHDTFYNLTNIYKIHSEHIIIDDWYLINNDYFQIELLEYENANKVDFYTVRLESDEGRNLVFTDTDPTDGWKYTNETIGKIINKQRGPDYFGFSFEPYFLMYTEVTLKDGSVIKTPNLPIYNK